MERHLWVCLWGTFQKGLQNRDPPWTWVEPSYGLGSQMEEEGTSELSATSISLCSQTADAMWPVAPCSFRHAFPFTMDCTLRPQPNETTLSCLCQVSWHSYEMRNWCSQYRQLNHVSQGAGVCPQEMHPIFVSFQGQPWNLGRAKPPRGVSHIRSPPSEAVATVLGRVLRTTIPPSLASHWKHLGGYTNSWHLRFSLHPKTERNCSRAQPGLADY